MAKYVDGFVLPIQPKNLAAYRRMARVASTIWREHGALQYMECAGEDLDVKVAMPFRRGIAAKRGETVVFAFIVYKSRAHRDRVTAKVMSDPRIARMMKGKEMPFDVARMLCGGFEVIVEA